MKDPSHRDLLLLQEDFRELHDIHDKQALTCMTPMANRPWEDILLGFSAFPLPPGVPAATAHPPFLGCTVHAHRQHRAGSMEGIAFQKCGTGAAAP